MESYEMVKKKWLAVKAQYSELIQSRVDLVDKEDWKTLTRQNGESNEYFEDEKKLYLEAEGFRKKLRNMMPEEHHFGKKNRSEYAISFCGNEFSKYGDNGYFICEKCKALFECPSQDECEKNGDNFHTDSFKECSDHSHIKKSGTMKANLGEIKWL